MKTTDFMMRFTAGSVEKKQFTKRIESSDYSVVSKDELKSKFGSKDRIHDQAEQTH